MCFCTLLSPCLKMKISLNDVITAWLLILDHYAHTSSAYPRSWPGPHFIYSRITDYLNVSIVKVKAVWETVVTCNTLNDKYHTGQHGQRFWFFVCDHKDTVLIWSWVSDQQREQDGIKPSMQLYCWLWSASHHVLSFWWLALSMCGII